AAAVAAGDWVIQVASFGKRDNAQALEQELGADFPTFHARAQINDQTWYRVRVGPFASRAEAENVAGELRAQGHNTLVQQLD
ncbi:MAG TPA: SPOR domain-containing protein, partial [Salinisphaeraceae bacterium]|nr:SPOR domain-containing protein [Salinisphaeraceae bacterium]